MASQEYQNFLTKLFANPPQPAPTIQELRANFEQWLSNYRAAKEIKIEPWQSGALQGLWVRAPHADSKKVVLFFHGGGFTLGSPTSHQDMMGRISELAGVAVLGLAYHLAPEHPFPAALEDALKAYKWLLAHGYPHDKIALAGASAGGGLCLSLLLALKKENQPLPTCAYLSSPWIDLTMQGDSINQNDGKDILTRARLSLHRDRYIGTAQQEDPLVSPLFGDLSGLPPLFIQVGRHDLLYSEAVVLAKKAKQAGVETVLDEWPEMIHFFPFFAQDFPEAREAIQKAGIFLGEKLRVSPST